MPRNQRTVWKVELKNNKSLKTVALWVFLIVIFVAIYTSVSRPGAGRQEKFSDFVSNALPPAYAATGTVPTMEKVLVYATGQNDAFIEYSVFPSTGAEAAAATTAGELAKTRTSHWTRGDLKMPLGVAEGGQTLYNALSDRGIAVKFMTPAEGWKPNGTEEPFSAFVSEVLQQTPRTNVKQITVRGKEIIGEYTNSRGSFTTVGDIGPYRQALVARGITVVE